MTRVLATNGTASFVRDMVNALGGFNASPRDPFLRDVAVFWGRGGVGRWCRICSASHRRGSEPQRCVVDRRGAGSIGLM